MISVDANILIGFTRTSDPAVGAILKRPDAGVCGVTRAEILHGARNPANAATLTAALDALVQVPTPEAIWGPLGANLAALRRAGIGVPFQDARLATVAIHHDAEVWSSDAHFVMMRAVLPALRLFVPPPAGPSSPVTP